MSIVHILFGWITLQLLLTTLSPTEKPCWFFSPSFLAKQWLSCQRWITLHVLSEHSLTIQSHKKQFLQGSISVRLDFEARGLAWHLVPIFIKTLNKNISPEHGSLVWFWVIWQRVLSTAGEGLGRKERQILPTALSEAYSHCMEIVNDKNFYPRCLPDSSSCPRTYLFFISLLFLLLSLKSQQQGFLHPLVL